MWLMGQRARGNAECGFRIAEWGAAAALVAEFGNTDYRLLDTDYFPDPSLALRALMGASRSVVSGVVYVRGGVGGGLGVGLCG